MNTIRRLISISATDPDDSRRRRLLSIILIGFTTLLVIALISISIVILSGRAQSMEGIYQLFYASAALLIGIVLIFLLNRYRSGKVAATAFLVLITLAFSGSDSLVEVSTGRSLFIFTIPIIMSSVLLAPASSFIFSGLSSLIISVIAISIGRTPNIPAIGGYFLVALVSWLSSRNLELALQNLREININLDRLVEEKTRELTASLNRESELAKRNQAVLESIADGVIVFDIHGNAIQANPALLNLLNLPGDQLVDSRVDWFVYKAPLDDENRNNLLDLLTKPESQATSHRIEWEDKTLSISVAVVYDNEQNAMGTVAVFRDFTREAEVERMKSAFVAMVSHELRTPLNAILGYAEMFKEQIYGLLNEKQLSITDRIVTNSRRLLSLINDLLDQAQIEAGKIDIKKETVVLSGLMEFLVGTMEQLASSKGLLLTTNIDSSLPRTLIGDNARLQQVLINLTNNAVKFTQKGSVSVQFSLVSESQWRITVSDTGQGIPANELPYIFDSFRQVEGTIIRQQGGTGLGLSIVKELVSLMEGEISVRSTPEIGSTFTVTLPLETEEGEVNIMSELAFIIEDDVDLSAIFTEALESVGYQVETIMDGLQAQQRLEKEIPRLILLDMHLPHISGEILLAKIKADTRYSNTNVVITTADARMAEAYSEIADFTMVKPISFVQLRDLTSRLRKQ